MVVETLLRAVSFLLETVSVVFPQLGAESTAVATSHAAHILRKGILSRMCGVPL